MASNGNNKLTLISKEYTDTVNNCNFKIVRNSNEVINVKENHMTESEEDESPV